MKPLWKEIATRQHDGRIERDGGRGVISKKVARHRLDMPSEGGQIRCAQCFEALLS